MAKYHYSRDMVTVHHLVNFEMVKGNHLLNMVYYNQFIVKW
jgi:hypothetical protein